MRRAPLHEGREAPGRLLDQVHRAAQIRFHGFPHHRTHGVFVFADKRVKHERYMPLPCMASPLPGGAIQSQLVGQLVGGLSEQVRQQVTAHFPGLLESFGVARRRQPDGKLSLDRARQRLNRHRFTDRARECNGLATPEPPDHVDIAHHVSFAVGKSLGCNDKVVGLPAGGKRNADPALGNIVNKRPLFCHAYRVVQRQHTASCANFHARGDCGDGCAGDGRVGIQAAKGVEVALRRPDSMETMRICKLRTFHQKLVAVLGCRRVLAGEIKQAELRRSLNCRCSMP